MLRTKTHQELLHAFNNKNVLYLCTLMQDHSGGSGSGSGGGGGGGIIVKIGSTQNIRQRMQNIARTFACKPQLLHVVECDMYKQFERFLHHHGNIKKYRYEVESPFTESTSRETYLVTPQRAKQGFCGVIDRHLERFRLSPAARAELEAAAQKLIELQQSSATATTTLDVDAPVSAVPYARMRAPRTRISNDLGYIFGKEVQVGTSHRIRRPTVKANM